MGFVAMDAANATKREALEKVVQHQWFGFSTLFVLSRLFATAEVRSQRLIAGTAPFGNG